MKLLLALFGLLFAPAVVYCQASGPVGEEMIGRMIHSGQYDGGADKMLGRMGDAAGVVVTKILGESNLGPNDVESVLTIIHLSFSAPLLVETPKDRIPRTTLFLLRSLDFATTDQKLKQRIAEERKFVLDQIAKPIKSGTP